jgi:hypothetical protein
MTKIRANVWKNEAKKEDFMLYLNGLANIYSGVVRDEKQKENGKYEVPDEFALFKDYKEWLKENG